MEIKIFYMLLCAVTIYCKDLLFVGENYPTSFYHCFRQAGNNQVILQLDFDFKDQYVSNVVSAKNAGLTVHAVFPLCRTKTLPELGEQFSKIFGTLTFQNVWLAPIVDDYSCSWMRYPSQQNCQYLKQMMQGLKKYNINSAIIISKAFWVLIFGSISACPQVSNFLSWWIPSDKDQDFQPNFDNYKQIGGWTKPFLKLYNERQICGVQDVSVSYYE